MTHLPTAAETHAAHTLLLLPVVREHPRLDMEEEEEGRVNGFGLIPGRGGSGWGPITLLDKTKEFFQTCDVEGKGFISRTDMRVRNGVCVCVCDGSGVTVCFQSCISE